MKKHFFVPINKEIFISKEVFIFSKWACQGLIWKNRVTSDPQIKNTVWMPYYQLLLGKIMNFISARFVKFYIKNGFANIF